MAVLAVIGLASARYHYNDRPEPRQVIALSVGPGGTTLSHYAPTASSSVDALSGEFAVCGFLNRQNCVIDGDTILYSGVKIRIADIDAPEITEPKCAAEAALGDRAKHRLVELMNAGHFRIVAAGGRDEDVYGRKLRRIERDGRSVADALVREGLARRWNGARRSWCN
ncbi:thermonuclease family protein [Microvirga brassicacearum]|uniref:Thermonuclease family protein n=1 Tax=Microvirga brassicacearum TaxID=2580413 RepID=A0A5N3P7X2_9HYPH|nr:thermonuclease family protein [Microvirga brassicacearum]KAB0265828.1 thermonuclease family protein [Microvirga brassicacearum]